MPPLVWTVSALVLSLPLSVSPSGSPTPQPGEVLPGSPPDELVTPGTIGFLVTFFVAVALVLLVRDMNRRVRRVRVRSDLADAQLRRELAEEAARRAADPDDGSPVRRH